VAPTATTSDQDSYLVVGVTPKNAKVFIWYGEEQGGVFHPNTFGPASFFDFPNDGFVVVKMRPRETAAIANVFLAENKGSFWGRQYLACSDSKAIRLNVPVGKVWYLGDVQYSFDVKGHLGAAFDRRNLEAVRAYLRSHYPGLADKLEAGPADFVTLEGLGIPDCSSD
jgi:hypothetical protein